MNYQPCLMMGKGVVSFGKHVSIGVFSSPGFFSGYAYIEARNQGSRISIGNNVQFSNNIMIIADASQITISDDCLIGAGLEIMDSNFHDLQVDRRHLTDPDPLPVFIGKNVFLGSSVKILKGVTIGDNAVIGHSSVVTKSIPPNAIAGGNPCRVIRFL